MATKTKKATPETGVALAIVAHPDDIEFQIAGTLCMLKEAGWKTHRTTGPNTELPGIMLSP